MTLENRIIRLEEASDIEEDNPEDAYSQRWQSAYLEITSTMNAHHHSIVHAGLVEFFNNGGGVGDYIEPFLAAQVYRLCNRAAQGFHAVLNMPPALAEVWIAYEHDRAPLISERHGALHSTADCADCGAEFPRLRPSQWDRSRRGFIGESRDYVTACLLCGGFVGFHLYKAA